MTSLRQKCRCTVQHLSLNVIPHVNRLPTFRQADLLNFLQRAIQQRSIEAGVAPAGDGRSITLAMKSHLISRPSATIPRASRVGFVSNETNIHGKLTGLC